MVLSVIVALITCPAMLATAEAIRQGQCKDRREEHRARRCNLVASCVRASGRSQEIEGRRIVLRDGKLFVDSVASGYDDRSSDDSEGGEKTGHGDGGDDNDDDDEEEEEVEEGGGGGGGRDNAERDANHTPPHHHPFAGYYLPYPDSNYEGLVSTIADDPPVLNWIYVDKTTHEVKYGVRVDAQTHVTGPFDCTRQDRRMTLEGWEGFVVVEEEPGLWALYFDRDDDGLRGKVGRGVRVLEVELWRREKRWVRDPSARVQEQAKQRT
ncbi:hypothetical protein PV04_10517 [Phialophora macrospora]|uniref:Uncharacterized protein n=1 Tax=Phialophora macrospora TaxID=1851006 RepID=A0A0D2CBG1_9EURO|nr:hypothetical protein PV04_10517 [Phialophora macrospora]